MLLPAVSGDVYKERHTNLFILIQCIWALFDKFVAERSAVKTEFHSPRGMFNTSGGQYNVSFSSLLLFLTVKYSLVILRLHYVLSPQLLKATRDARG